MCWRGLACFDDVVGEAAVAKGTFYLPFDGLAGLQGAVGDELAHEFDELLQPRRLATQDPIERIAAGCGAFVGEALRKPAWGALVARGALSLPNVALGARNLGADRQPLERVPFRAIVSGVNIYAVMATTRYCVASGPNIRTTFQL
jgi:hypothetical protein